MEYRHRSPVTKTKRAAQRRAARQTESQRQRRRRPRAKRGGQPDELGVTQGQNGEQGNTLDPRQSRPVAQPY